MLIDCYCCVRLQEHRLPDQPDESLLFQRHCQRTSIGKNVLLFLSVLELETAAFLRFCRSECSSWIVLRVESQDEQQVHRGENKGNFPSFFSPQPWNIFRLLHEGGGARNSCNKIFALLKGAGGVELNQSPEVITVRRGPSIFLGKLEHHAFQHTLADTRSDFSFFWSKWRITEKYWPSTNSSD